MGQYHRAFAVDDDGMVETIDHYSFGAGAKLAEQSYTIGGEDWPGDIAAFANEMGVTIASPYSQALALMAMGPWAGRKLVVVGDYADPPHVRYYEMDGADESTLEIHRLAGAMFRNVTDMALRLWCEATGWTAEGTGWQETVPPADLADRIRRLPKGDQGYVVVSTKREFFDPVRFGSPANPIGMVSVGGAWPIVNVLLAVSDGRGGGDFCWDPAGRWADSKIQVVPRHDVPNDYLDITGWIADQSVRGSWGAVVAHG